MKKGTAVTVDPEELERFANRVLSKAGLDRTDAEIVADTLVDANLRGIDTHGVVRLEPYVERIEKGGTRPDAEMTVREAEGAPSAAVVDANGGPGQVATRLAMREAIDRANEQGSAFVGVRNSNHFGTASYYTNLAAREGCIGFATTHAGPNVAPFGGADPFFGTNPISFSVPTDRGFPISVDMATSVTAKGNVILAEEEGEEIPPEWAVDEEGAPITDPEEFHALQPMGGPKGYGLALIVDVLCGVLLDTAFGEDVPTMYHDLTEPQGLGHFVGAISIEAFTGGEGFHERLSALIEQLKAVQTAEGVDEILLPGEPEAQTREARIEEGIPLGDGVWESLQALADEYDLELSATE